MEEIETTEVELGASTGRKIASVASLGLAVVGAWVVAKKTLVLATEFVQKVHPTN